MRNLKFTNDEVGKTKFEIVFHGMIIYGNQNTNKGLTVLRTEISLLDKIEGISKPCDCGKKIGNDDDRELDFSGPEDKGPSIQITENEFDLLYDYISKVPWSIGKSSRDALKTLDWLKNSNDSPVS